MQIRFKPPKLSPDYQQLLDEVIADLEKNELPWKKPWFNKIPTNFFTKKPYRGINVLNLIWHAQKTNFQSHYWLTANQASRLRSSVKKEEIKNFTSIFLYKWNIKKGKSKTGRDMKIAWLMMKTVPVYNLEQIKGLNYSRDDIQINIWNTKDDADKIIKGYNEPPYICHGKDKAYYNCTNDFIGIPELNQFVEVEEYYSTLFHELIHSTGHKKRLKRSSFLEAAAFGSKRYAKEELVAEIGAAFLCGRCNFFCQTKKNTQAYLKSWLDVLKKDKTFLLWVSKSSQLACDYIISGRTNEKADLTEIDDKIKKTEIEFLQEEWY